MTYEEVDVILAQRGYERIKSPYSNTWRGGWLWVQPKCVNPIPTKLCLGVHGLCEEGLCFLLDSYCELRGGYFSNEQRARNEARMSLNAQQKTDSRFSTV